MPTAAQLKAVRSLIAATPDAALGRLAAALGAGGEEFAPVLDIVLQEQMRRRTRQAAFAPVLPLFRARPDGVSTPVFPPSLLTGVWKALGEHCSPAMQVATRDFELWEPDYDPAPETLNVLCREAARLLEEGLCGAEETGQARELALYFKLAPLARLALARLPDWLGKATEERAAVLRLIFKDATSVCEDSAPRLMEMVLGQLEEAALILRPISLLTDRAGDRYLADSELRGFGERILALAERHVAGLKAFDPSGGAAAAHVAAAHARLAGDILAELEHSVDLSRDGPWGRRVAQSRQMIAGAIETRLREAEKAVEHALPMQEVRLTGRMTRPAPRLDAPPDPRFVEPARGLLTLLGETRHAAASGGFGALRTQVAEALSEWLEIYADELVHMLNGGEARDPAVAHQYLELAAEFLGCAENPKAAQIVRRRAAVAGAGVPSQDVA